MEITLTPEQEKRINRFLDSTQFVVGIAIGLVHQILQPRVLAFALGEAIGTTDHRQLITPA